MGEDKNEAFTCLAVKHSPISITSDPIGQLTWRIATPISIGMFFNTMFNFIDTYFAGLLSTDALAALSLSFPVFFLLVALGSGLSQGTTALIANALGQGEQEEARHIYAQSLLLAVVVGLCASTIGLYVTPSLFVWLGATQAYLATTLAFMNVILVGGVFFILTMAFNSVLNAQGQTQQYRNFLVAGFIANCALNPLLMWGWCGIPAMGVSGLALATVIVQMVGCVYLWCVARSSSLCESLKLHHFRFDAKVIGKVASQSLPAALSMITIALGVFVMTSFVKNFGKEAVAAVGIAMRLEQIVLLPVIGLSSAVLSIVGQNYGAGLYARVREAWSTNLKYGVALMLLGGVILLVAGRPAMAIFTADATVIMHGRNYLKAAACTLAAYPILFVTVFMMQGLKRPRYGLLIGIYRQVLAPLCVFNLLILFFDWGLWGVWWGICFVNWSAALFAFWWGKRTLDKLA